MVEDLKKLQKTEALNRLRILQMKYELMETYVNIIKEIEEQQNILVYHAILTPTIDGTYLTLLYVSQYQEEWQGDRNALNEGIPLAYCINLADPQMAEFGGIQIAGAMGGIVRLA